MGHRTAGAPPTADVAANTGTGRGRGAARALALLAASNVATNRLLPEWAYVPWNLGLATGLLGLARRAGVDRQALGTHPDDLRRGVATGAVVAGVVALGYAVALRRAPRALQDERATRLTTRQAAFQALARIPLGTVVAEEVAFRGVLPALLATPRRSGWLPGAASSVAFGLWHVLPSRELAAANASAARLGPTGTTALAVATTTVAGGLLHGLRRRGGHLAAPMLVHAAANVLGLLAARRAGTGGPRTRRRR